MRVLISLMAIAAALGAVDPSFAGGRPMSDEELAGVTARGLAPAVDRPLGTSEVFTFDNLSTGNVTVDGAAELRILPMTALPQGIGTGQVTLSGAAQQNLSALVNFNAANAIVQVFLNLNVTLNSNVNRVVQSNLGALH